MHDKRRGRDYRPWRGGTWGCGCTSVVVVLTAGPGTVKGVYPVDLPRPRNVAEIRFQPEFARIYREIWNDLRDEVQLSYERSKRNLS